jgi:hypothetical protein
MPTNEAQWAWFAFFVIGTIGGWVFIGWLIYRFRQLQDAPAPANVEAVHDNAQREVEILRAALARCVAWEESDEQWSDVMMAAREALGVRDG